MAAQLTVNLTANVENLRKQLKRANERIAKMTEQSKKASGGMKNMTKSAGGLLGAITPLRLGLVGLTAGLVSFGKSQLESIDRVGKLSTAYGIQVETLQKWQHAAKLGGSSLESLVKGSKKLSDTIYDANSGLVTYQRAFTDLGLNWEELAQMSPEGQMNAVARSLMGVENAYKRTAIAGDVLGRSGAELTATFEDWEKSMDSLSESSILTDEQVKAVEDFNDSIVILKAKIMGVVVDLVERWGPVVKDVVNFIRTHWQPVVATLAGVIAGVLTAKIYALVAAIGVKITAIVAAVAASGTLTVSLKGLGVAMYAALGPVGLLVAAVGAVVAAVVLAYTKSETFRDVVHAVWNYIQTTVGPIINAFVGTIKGIVSVVETLAEWFGKDKNKKVIDPMVEHNLEQARLLKEGVSNAMTGVVTATGEAARATAELNEIMLRVSKGEIDIAGVYGQYKSVIEGGVNTIQAIREAAILGDEAFKKRGGRPLPEAGGPSSDAYLGPDIIKPSTDPRVRGVTGTATDIPFDMLQDYHKRGVISDETYGAYLEAQLGNYLETDHTYEATRRRQALKGLSDPSTAGGGSVGTPSSVVSEDERSIELERLAAMNEMKLISDAEYVTSLQVIYDSFNDKLGRDAMSVYRIIKGKQREIQDQILQATRDELADKAELYREGKISFEEYMEFLVAKFGEATGEMAEDIAELMETTRSDRERLLAGRYSGFIQDVVDAFRSGEVGAKTAKTWLDAISRTEAGGEEARRAIAEIGIADTENRFRAGAISTADFIAFLRQQQSELIKFTDPWTRIEERITQLMPKPDDGLFVVLKSDDKPERLVRAETGPVNARPRGAC